MDLWLRADGRDPISTLEELTDWLRHEPELRGRTRLVTNKPAVGELGAAIDALVVAVGSGGMLSVLAASLRTFLAQPRRSDVRIVLTTQDGRKIEIEAKRIGDVEALVQRALGSGNDD